MRYRIWKQTIDLGDGSSSTNIFPTREEAFEGYDEEGFCLTSCPEVPIEVEESFFDTTGYEVIS